MRLEIADQIENKLLKRIEMKITVEEEKTPSRKELLAQIAAKLGKDADVISINKIEQKFGEKKSITYARIYDTKEDKIKNESKYILERTEGKKEENKETEKGSE